MATTTGCVLNLQHREEGKGWGGTRENEEEEERRNVKDKDTEGGGRESV